MFIVSGSEKLIGPYQNFLYVVQEYDVFAIPLEEVVARVVPWVELFLGVFLLLGLWLKYALRAASLLVAGFIVIVTQALLRNLPITECGCFGELVSFPLHVVLMFDCALLLLTGLLICREQQVRRFSLDSYYSKDA